ncbi:T-cell acute lymphocytic leukemia protein 1 isoform X2 [Leptopilina heterotoma]|uniref:T-cell acute lymphocytic leukemia protein 1 isoform X2 n=1 Tax=Leptopilina heterotoma TaxID=63436 RepID=UPI001CA87117|nr:T-cell acute lymphocytic leukemia protein 1 isoform X2 [Leptopilina heterotoma]
MSIKLSHKRNYNAQAITFTGVMEGSERDAGFCSGADEDDMSGLHSPSASEDSVEVQVTPISLRNKRKLAEPRKILEPSTAPLKKRRRFEILQETDEESRPATSPSPSPFRPWSSSTKTESKKSVNSCFNVDKAKDSSDEQKQTEEEQKKEERKELYLQEEAQRRYEARIQEEVLQRLHESNRRPTSPSECSTRSSVYSGQRRESRQRFEPPLPPPPPPMSAHQRLQDEPLSLVLRGEVLRGEVPRVPSHPAVSGGSFERPTTYHMDHVLPSQTTSNDHARHHLPNGQQRNYKNMTRERRIEANARERTRVHTISAAFDTLRRAIPAYSHNQKLSKLSVLRIACSYIMTLSKIVNTPEGEPENNVSLGACVDLVSKTIQTEGKLRKKKDE